MLSTLFPSALRRWVFHNYAAGGQHESCCDEAELWSLSRGAPCSDLEGRLASERLLDPGLETSTSVPVRYSSTASGSQLRAHPLPLASVKPKAASSSLSPGVSLEAPSSSPHGSLLAQITSPLSSPSPSPEITASSSLSPPQGGAPPVAVASTSPSEGALTTTSQQQPDRPSPTRLPGGRRVLLPGSQWSMVQQAVRDGRVGNLTADKRYSVVRALLAAEKEFNHPSLL